MDVVSHMMDHSYMPEEMSLIGFEFSGLCYLDEKVNFKKVDSQLEEFIW